MITSFRLVSLYDRCGSIVNLECPFCEDEGIYSPIYSNLNDFKCYSCMRAIEPHDFSVYSLTFGVGLRTILR